MVERAKALLECSAKKFVLHNFVETQKLREYALVDVGTDPAHPTLLSVLKDSTNMDFATAVALDASAGLAYVAAQNSDSLAIVAPSAMTWCVQDFSISSNRRNITLWV